MKYHVQAHKKYNSVMLECILFVHMKTILSDEQFYHSQMIKTNENMRIYNIVVNVNGEAAENRQFWRTPSYSSAALACADLIGVRFA